jgi:hypothetical protein
MLIQVTSNVLLGPAKKGESGLSTYQEARNRVGRDVYKMCTYSISGGVPYVDMAM